MANNYILDSGHEVFDVVTMKTVKAPKVAPPAPVPMGPCPPDCVDMGRLRVRPLVKWAAMTGPFGCYAAYLANVHLTVKDVTHKDGFALTYEDYIVGGDGGFLPKFMNREMYEWSDRTYGCTVMNGANLSSILSKDRELFKQLFRVGMNNAWNEFYRSYSAVGMVMFGDVTRPGISQYVTGWLAWYLKERGEGVLSATHGVVNPNYANPPRVCQVWAWSSDKQASITTAGGHQTALLKRDVAELQSNLDHR